MGWGGVGRGAIACKVSAQTGSKIVDIYREIELLLLVYSVLIKTFDLKLDFCPFIFGGFIGFEIKI